MHAALITHETYRSSWTRGGRSFRGHQCQRGQQWCAIVLFQLVSVLSIACTTYADNALRPDKLDELVLVATLGVARAIGLEVT